MLKKCSGVWSGTTGNWLQNIGYSEELSAVWVPDKEQLDDGTCRGE